MECALASPVPGGKTGVSQNGTGTVHGVKPSSHTACNSELQAYCPKSTSVSFFLEVDTGPNGMPMHSVRRRSCHYYKNLGQGFWPMVLLTLGLDKCFMVE